MSLKWFGNPMVARKLIQKPFTFSTARYFFPSSVTATNHDVNGFNCYELKIVLPENRKGLDAVTILEADAEAQERLINIALDNDAKEVDEDPYGSVLW
jgi:hypothetical protein